MAAHGVPSPITPWRPTRAELEAADGRAIPDVIAPGLKVLFCGINPGRYSGATGRHFARPGNRFWPTLHAAGFTERLLTPWDGDAMLAAGFGITNLVNRTTATAAELGGHGAPRGRRPPARDRGALPTGLRGHPRHLGLPDRLRSTEGRHGTPA